MRDRAITPSILGRLVSMKLEHHGLPAKLAHAFRRAGSWPQFETALDDLLKYCDKEGITVEQ